MMISTPPIAPPIAQMSDRLPPLKNQATSPQRESTTTAFAVEGEAS